ncbi:unnamed protein product [Protopolystoma xenopodis]|uniref:Uncharacterized protein n=1 Tax=Protopolystoma xenopodis TaxID=117903 RepID=A0A3S5AUQ9_9PLAT|nr:unnamed protein product [Protopolystoma xenopodis]
MAGVKCNTLAGEDIFNSVLQSKPGLLYHLPCQWNVQLGRSSETWLCDCHWPLPGRADLQADSILKIAHWNSADKTFLRVGKVDELVAVPDDEMPSVGAQTRSDLHLSYNSSKKTNTDHVTGPASEVVMKGRSRTSKRKSIISVKLSDFEEGKLIVAMINHI